MVHADFYYRKAVHYYVVYFTAYRQVHADFVASITVDVIIPEIRYWLSVRSMSVTVLYYLDVMGILNYYKRSKDTHYRIYRYNTTTVHVTTASISERNFETVVERHRLHYAVAFTRVVNHDYLSAYLTTIVTEVIKKAVINFNGAVIYGNVAYRSLW